jgi:hypothetical protein
LSEEKKKQYENSERKWEQILLIVYFLGFFFLSLLT